MQRLFCNKISLPVLSVSMGYVPVQILCARMTELLHMHWTDVILSPPMKTPSAQHSEGDTGEECQTMEEMLSIADFSPALRGSFFFSFHTFILSEQKNSIQHSIETEH